jgi:hypothetical protein
MEKMRPERSGFEVRVRAEGTSRERSDRSGEEGAEVVEEGEVGVAGVVGVAAGPGAEVTAEGAMEVDEDIWV